MNTVAEILRTNNVLLAPMAGVTEPPFRAICKRYGAGLTYTEMVSAKGLHYSPDAASARGLLSFADEEVPCAVQLFGADPGLMADQASRIVESAGERIALLDINMGCPVAKVVGKGEGSALMQDARLAATIVKEVASACSVPVTVKIRAGWDDQSLNAAEFAARMVDAGARGVAVHGRTREQFYRGKADWSVIASVKRAVDVPVIGSGDVFSAEDVVSMIERTGVDGVMIARGAQGNPWIFAQARALLDRGERLDPPTAAERIDVAREHARKLVAFAGERAHVRMRKHVAWYVSGLPGATYCRRRVNECGSYAELDELLVEYRAFVVGD